ncbi:hypothetical protein GCM10007860_11210 [Chitiniphilus shinanonensis]|uniref:Helix-turn-helix domain-containing protein n=1 Tax=Chitiniphilus shinanonensis TaxID=553088 RepID=A0ABQ6BPL0_9NEIS|nr:helix-turn-helix domain-containing protein [Chitiniphilus shinanonensis]GLS03975.1 hypothetical protein GCM10007860_11210 [Chitiniphilus shinanonensis]
MNIPSNELGLPTDLVAEVEAAAVLGWPLPVLIERRELGIGPRCYVLGDTDHRQLCYSQAELNALRADPANLLTRADAARLRLNHQLQKGGFNPDRLTPAQAAILIGLSEATLNTKRSRGGGIAYFKQGRRVFYRLADLEHYQASRTQRMGKGAGA